MYFEIFLDVLFLRNLVMDYLLLRAVNRLLGRREGWLRSLWGSLIGALGVCLWILIPAGNGMGSAILVQAALSTIMVRVGCHTRTRRELAGGVLLLWAASAVAAGVWQLLLPYVRGRGPWEFLVLGAAGAGLPAAGIQVYRRKKGRAEHTYYVTLYANGKCKGVKGLYDTGNGLWDSTVGKPVSIVEPGVLEDLFSQEEMKGMKALLGGAWEQELPEGLRRCRPHYIPFSTVGRRDGLGGGPVPGGRVLFQGVWYDFKSKSDRQLGGKRMNAAIARKLHFQVLPGFSRMVMRRPGELYYIGGSDVLPPPLPPEREAQVIEMLGSQDKEEAKTELIEHNLRLVVYIAQKFDNTGVGVEDLISIGTIGLIKAINTFNPQKKIKLATYASRCIENEILMYLRRNNKTRMEVSIDEPLNVDWDGNELLLSDILGTDEDVIYRDLEHEVECRLLVKAIGKLSRREQTIIRLRFGLNMPDGQEKTQKEVADLLGISQSYISRLEKRIMVRLRKEIVRYE